MIPVPETILTSITDAFGIRKDALLYLGGGRAGSDGIAYSFIRNGKDLVLKIMAFPEKNEAKALKEIEERLQFVNFIGKNGVDIVYPLVNDHHRLMESFHADGHVFIGYIMNRIDGNHPSKDDLNSDFYRQYGMTIGKLHRLTKLYPKWRGSGPDGDTQVLGWREEIKQFWNWCKDPDIKQCWSEMEQWLEKLPITRNCYGFIHNDPHLNNILKTETKTVLIDFDVANFHWFATDIAIAAESIRLATFGGMNRPDINPLKVFFDSFLNGYEAENHIDDFWLRKMDQFMNYRRMLIFTVVQAELEKKPDEKERLKEMILKNPVIVRKLFG